MTAWWLPGARLSVVADYGITYGTRQDDQFVVVKPDFQTSRWQI